MKTTSNTTFVVLYADLPVTDYDEETDNETEHHFTLEEALSWIDNQPANVQSCYRVVSLINYAFEQEEQSSWEL